MRTRRPWALLGWASRRRAARSAGLMAVGAAALMVMAAPVGAGPPVTDGISSLQLEAAVRPATTATRARPRPVALWLSLRSPSVSGGPAASGGLAVLDLPRGMDVNLDPRPSCRWTALLRRGSNGCATRSRVGSGTAVLDGRPAGRGYPLRARVRVFSALLDGGDPTASPRFRPFPVLAVHAFAPGAEVFVPLYPNRVSNPSGLVVQNSLTSVPLGVGVEQLSVNFRRLRWPRAKGGKPFIQAPTRCAGSWHFTASAGVLGSPPLVAMDDVPCRRGR